MSGPPIALRVPIAALGNCVYAARVKVIPFDAT